MTPAQRLFDEAFQEGRRRGLEEGYQAALRGFLQRLIGRHFGDEGYALIDRLVDTASMEQIERFVHRAASAKTLRELLTD